tara:strand:- start:344 stop:601 length:258 start_codon:yes stop_codon:yes gene_type:complete
MDKIKSTLSGLMSSFYGAKKPLTAVEQLEKSTIIDNTEYNTESSGMLGGKKRNKKGLKKTKRKQGGKKSKHTTKSAKYKTRRHKK